MLAALHVTAATIGLLRLGLGVVPQRHRLPDGGDRPAAQEDVGRHLRPEGAVGARWSHEDLDEGEGKHACSDTGGGATGESEMKEWQGAMSDKAGGLFSRQCRNHHLERNLCAAQRNRRTDEVLEDTNVCEAFGTYPIACRRGTKATGRGRSDRRAQRNHLQRIGNGRLAISMHYASSVSGMTRATTE